MSETEELIDNYKKTIEILEKEKQVLKDELLRLYLNSQSIYKENFKLRDELERIEKIICQ